MPYPLNTPLGRFGVETDEAGSDRCVASISAAGMVNPITGAPTIAAVAMLVDHIGGLINHCRRAPDQWTVSSELSVEFTHDAVDAIAAAPDVAVVGVARPLGRTDRSALGVCELRVGADSIATATVRSFYIDVPADIAAWPDEPAGTLPGIGLAELMAVEVGETGSAAQVLMQREDPVLNNLVGIVHGGVSSMGLELVGSAALTDAGVRTASLRVNFLRPFHSGHDAHYVGTAVHAGRSSGVAEARAVGHDGRIASLARVTGYR